MEVNEAKSMIEKGVPSIENSVCADLGCGGGVFTYALANLLRSGQVIAVDKSTQQRRQVVGTTKIEFVQSDLELETFPFDKVNGVLMANSLHYIKDQPPFIRELKYHLRVGGRIILVEYDTDRANQWVPFPISLKKAKELFIENGFTNVTKIGERKSVFRSELMYACQIT